LKRRDAPGKLQNVTKRDPRGTVFIVEDDPDFASALVELIMDEGFRAVRFNDGLAALEGLSRETPVLIITDLAMPGMSGAQLVRALRANESWRKIPVVIVTGGNDTALPARLDTPVIYKPDIDSLLRVLPTAARTA
jgi:CheY-like chemotaxis protein